MTSCRSLPRYASVIGLRANAIAIAVPNCTRCGVLGRDRERDERIVLGLEAEHAVVPDLLEPRVDGPDVAGILERAGGEDLHRAGSGRVVGWLDAWRFIWGNGVGVICSRTASGALEVAAGVPDAERALDPVACRPSTGSSASAW